TDILWARSATVMVSGTRTSRTIGSLGCATGASPRPRPRPVRPRPRAPGPARPGPARQPPRSAPLSPRVLSPPRRRFASSDQVEESFSDLTCFLPPPRSSSSPAGLPVPARWSVPLAATSCAEAVASGAGAGAGLGLGRRASVIRRLISATSASTARRARSCCSASSRALRAASAAASAFARASASAPSSRLAARLRSRSASSARRFASAAASDSRCRSSSRRSCFSRSSAACRSRSWRWRRSSSSRAASSSLSMTGAGAGGASGVAGPPSRLTNTRFLRTSTWIVRALPVASACLISDVFLRVRVILRLGAPSPPCALRSASSSCSLSASLRLSSGEDLRTPAALSCSSSTSVGIFSSAAKAETVLLISLLRWSDRWRSEDAIASSFSMTASGVLVLEPVGSRLHDQVLRLLLVEVGDLQQLIDGQFGEIIAREHLGIREPGGEIPVHAFERKQILGRRADPLLGCYRLRQEDVAGPGAQFVDGLGVERLDLLELVRRHVGHLLEAGEALVDQDLGNLLVHVELVHEEPHRLRAFALELLGRFLGGHDVDLPAGQLGSEAHVATARADGEREVVLVDHHVHAARILVDDDRRDVGGRQRADDELRRVLGPQDDVDPLAGQLARHRLHAGAAHTDAGADGIDATIVGVHRDLGAHARIAGRRLDLEQALLDLGHLDGEQVPDELRRSPRQEKLRAPALAIDAGDVGADPVARAQVLLGNHLVAGQSRLELARLDHGALAVDPLHGSGQDRL